MPKPDFAMLFEHLPNAFAYHEVIWDDQHQPVDYVFRYVNRAFEAMTALSRGDILGKSVTEVLPGITSSAFDWIGEYGRVAQTGEMLHIEQYSEPLARWYEGTAYSCEEGFFAVVFRDISDKKQAEAEYARRIEHAMSLVENAPDIIVRFNRDLQHIYCNHAVEHYLGVPKSTFIGRTLLELDGPQEQLQNMHAVLQQALSSGEEQTTEQRFVMPDGYRCFQTRIVPEKNAANRVLSLLAVSRDVTAQKNSEERLQQSALDQQMLLDTIDVQIWYLSDAEHYGAVNKAHAAFFGLDKHQLENKSLFDLLPEDEAVLCVAGNQQVIAQKEVVRALEWVTNGEGEQRLLSITKSPKLNAEQQVDYVVCSAVDVTKEQKLHQELAEREEKLRVIFEAAHNISLIMTDVQRDQPTILEFNPGAEHIFGYTRAEMIGQSVTVLHSPADAARFPALFEQLERERKAISFDETVLVRRSGKTFPAMFTLYPLLDHTGAVWATLGVTVDITEQKQAEQKLQEREAQLRGILESQNDLIVRVDLENRLTYVNEVYCRTFGRERSELIGQSFAPLVHEEDLVPTLEAMKQLLHPPHRVYVEQRALTVAGWRWLAWEDSAILDQDGRVREIQAVGRDITEHKKALQALQTSEERYRAIVEDQTELICRFRPDGVLTFVNQAYCRYFAKEPNDLLEKSFLPLIPAEDQEAVQAAQSMLSPDRPVVSYEHRVQLADGTIRWQQWFDRALYDSQGQVVEYQAVGRDITAQKEAELELEKARRELEQRVEERTCELATANTRLRQEIEDHRQTEAELADERNLLAVTLSSVGDGVITTDTQGMISYVNRRAAEIIGCKPEAAIGQPLAQVYVIAVEDSDDSICTDPLARLLSRQTKELAEHHSLLTEHHGRRIIAAHAEPIQDEQEDPFGYVLAFRDVTEQQRLEMQLALTRKLESIGRMTAGIAHEINTPMQYIADNAEYLRETFEGLLHWLNAHPQLLQQLEERAASSRFDGLDANVDMDMLREEIPEAIDDLLAGVTTVSTLIRALRGFSHPGVNQKVPADLNKAVEGALVIARSEWKHLADVKTAYEQALPPVPCNLGEISQVVLNMIVNAAHAIGRALDLELITRGEITVTTRSTAEQVQIRIGDNGTGIAPVHRERLFDPFFTTKEVGQGTGQGLAIAYDTVVNKHGGTLDVESEEGKGAIFTITLPKNVQPLD